MQPFVVQVVLITIMRTFRHGMARLQGAYVWSSDQGCFMHQTAFASVGSGEYARNSYRVYDVQLRWDGVIGEHRPASLHSHGAVMHIGKLVSLSAPGHGVSA